MAEPFGTIWLVVVGAGGYVLLVVQFFKDYLSVRKLELEITQLRQQGKDKKSLVVLATPEEIERYGKLLTEAKLKQRRTSGIVLGASLVGVCSVLFVGVQSDSKAPSHTASQPNVSITGSESVGVGTASGGSVFIGPPNQPASAASAAASAARP